MSSNSSDHRASEEIEQEPALSVLFAAVPRLKHRRARACARTAGRRRPAREADGTSELRSVRGHIRCAEPNTRVSPTGYSRSWCPRRHRTELINYLKPDEGGRTPPLEEVIESAFRDQSGPEVAAPMTQRSVTAGRKRVTTEARTEAVEHGLARVVGESDKDEKAYWWAVMKLGGFGGRIDPSVQWGKVAGGWIGRFNRASAFYALS